MLHAAAHQLNHEVARLDLSRWLDEGIADYFDTSAFARGTIRLGAPDVNTCPQVPPPFCRRLRSGFPVGSLVTAWGTSVSHECLTV